MHPFDELPRLRSDEGELLWQQPDNPHLQVRQWRGWRWLTLGERRHTLQGLMQIDHPDLPQLPYAVAMLTGLIAGPAPSPSSLLNLGLGCGSFERFVQTHYPATTVTSIEHDAALLEVAQRWFQLSPQHPVTIADALHFLSTDQGHYDQLLCDLHDGEGQALVHQPVFCERLVQRLQPDGVLSLNLLDVSESELVTLLLRIRCSLPAVWIIEPPRSRNLVLIAARWLPDSDTLTARAKALSDRSGLDLSPYLSAITRLPPAGPR